MQCNAVLPIKQSVDYKNNCVRCVYGTTDWLPGVTAEDEAPEDTAANLKVYRLITQTCAAPWFDGEETGIAKFLRRHGRLVGAHILGEAAAEVIHEAQVLKAFRKPSPQALLCDPCISDICSGSYRQVSQLAYLDRMGESFFVARALG